MLLYVLHSTLKDTPELFEPGWKRNFKIVCLRPERNLSFSKNVALKNGFN